MGLLVAFGLLTVFILVMSLIPDEIFTQTKIRQMQSGPGAVLMETEHRLEHVILGSLDPPSVVFHARKPFQWSASLDLRILLILHEDSLIIFRDGIRRQTLAMSSTHAHLSVSPDGTRAIVCHLDQIWQITLESETHLYQCEPTHLDRSIPCPVHQVTLGDSTLVIAGDTTALFRSGDLVGGYEWFQEIPIVALMTQLHSSGDLVLSDVFGTHIYHQATPRDEFVAVERPLLELSVYAPEMVAKDDLIPAELKFESSPRLLWRLYMYSPHRLRAERRVKLQKRRKARNESNRPSGRASHHPSGQASNRPNPKSRSRSPPPRRTLATIYEQLPTIFPSHAVELSIGLSAASPPKNQNLIELTVPLRL